MSPHIYTKKDFSHLLGTTGFSDALLQNHFGLYEGYVNNVNALQEKLAALQTAGEFGPEFAELKRRFGWEYNGMRLHELYFGNMSVQPATPSEDVTEKLSEQFGSFDAWKEDFLKTGSMRGIGWVVLACDEETGALYNTWINEHDLGLLAGSRILLVMDVFEHAFILDYGTKKADYLDAFYNALDWNVVAKRLQ